MNTNNPSAFPVIDSKSYPHRNEMIVETYTKDCGMTLLDYFAGQVISKILPDETLPELRTNAGYYAKIAYSIAKAMLKERQEQL